MSILFTRFHQGSIQGETSMVLAFPLLSLTHFGQESNVVKDVLTKGY